MRAPSAHLRDAPSPPNRSRSTSATVVEFGRWRTRALALGHLCLARPSRFARHTMWGQPRTRTGPASQNCLTMIVFGPAPHPHGAGRAPSRD